MPRATRRCLLAWAGLIAPTLAADGAAAQTAQRPAPTREQVTPPTPEAPPPPAASVDARAALAQAECPFDAAPVRLALTGVRFTRPDGGALPPAVAAALVEIAAPTGDQPASVVCALRDRANAALRRAGWVASVRIPPQPLGPVLLLHVVTARITAVTLHGAGGPYRRALERRIALLKTLDPLNERDAERVLLLAGDIPGLEVQLALRPGAADGEVVGDLTVAYRRFALVGSLQNLDSRALGRETAYARAEWYGLTGLSDLTYLGASTTLQPKEQQIVQGGHILGLDGAGTTLGGRVTYAWSRPDLGALVLRTDTLIAGIDLMRPLLRSTGGNLRLAAGADLIDQHTDLRLDGVRLPLTLDKLRIGYLRASGDLARRRADGTGVLTLAGGVELRQGLGVLGATRQGVAAADGAFPSRPFGSARATVVRADLDAVVGLGQIVSVAAAVRGQWANRPLLNYEEFSLGNLTIGRGYDPGANSGDRALGVRLEPRAALPVARRWAPELFGFVDAVVLTNLDPGATEVDRRLRSVGGGVRLTLPGRLALEGMYAHPLDRALVGDAAPPDDRVLLSLVARLRDRAR